MAKKRKTKKTVTKTVDNAGGTVSCYLGFKISTKYAAKVADMNVGATLPIQPGETEKQASNRCVDFVESILDERAEGTIDKLWKRVEKELDQRSDDERSSKRRT